MSALNLLGGNPLLMSLVALNSFKGKLSKNNSNGKNQKQRKATPGVPGPPKNENRPSNVNGNKPANPLNNNKSASNKQNVNSTKNKINKSVGKTPQRNTNIPLDQKKQENPKSTIQNKQNNKKGQSKNSIRITPIESLLKNKQKSRKNQSSSKNIHHNNTGSYSKMPTSINQPVESKEANSKVIDEGIPKNTLNTKSQINSLEKLNAKKDSKKDKAKKNEYQEALRKFLEENEISEIYNDKTSSKKIKQSISAEDCYEPDDDDDD